MSITFIIATSLMLIWILSELISWLIRRSRNAPPDLFQYHYVNGLSYYYHRFREVPSVWEVSNIDMSKVNEYLSEKMDHRLVDFYQYCYYDREEKNQLLTTGLFVLEENMILELAAATVKLMYTNQHADIAEKLIRELSQFTIEVKSDDAEINIIRFSGGAPELSRIRINHTRLDIDLFYNDDFAAVDRLICSRLNQENDKGLILLHGLPGTGKTSYLRHLICQLDKRVLFVSPSAAGKLMDPHFIDLLIDYPNSVLVIEDAEKIMMDRNIKPDSSVSNLLNLSDGLLSDCLNVQIICTFNSPLSMVDTALMRKGRLVAMYEFGKLNVEKAQRLSKHLGFDTMINKPMTLAEIVNQHEKDYNLHQAKSIGFRSNENGLEE